MIKNTPANLAGDAREAGSISGSGWSPGEGNGNSLQYFCLENSMDRRAWWPTDHRVAKSHTCLSEYLHGHVCVHTYMYVWESKVEITLYRLIQHIFLACCKWNIIWHLAPSLCVLEKKNLLSPKVRNDFNDTDILTFAKNYCRKISHRTLRRIGSFHAKMGLVSHIFLVENNFHIHIKNWKLLHDSDFYYHLSHGIRKFPVL